MVRGSMEVFQDAIMAVKGLGEGRIDVRQQGGRVPQGVSGRLGATCVSS